MYSLGVSLAILSGTAHTVGILLQRKVITRIAGDRQGFFARLIRCPLSAPGASRKKGRNTEHIFTKSCKKG